MKSIRFSLSFLIVCLSVRTLVALPQERDLIGQAVQSSYKGRSLRLRNFYVGSTLEFDSKGSIVNGGKVGPWTLYGVILVDSLKVKPRTLEIQAYRLFLHFITADMKFQALRDGRVWIRIDLDHELSSAQELEPVLAKVFVNSGEDFSALVPSYWKEFCSRLDARDWSVKAPEKPIGNHKAEGKWTAPVGLHTPTPPYSSEARKARINGTLALFLMVDSNGHVSDVSLSSPLGMGLDESAVETVRTWTFKPAERDGQVKSVKVMVEVSFHTS